jgi:AraC-like DNA-binding protein/quercetin dioxygenase-like cupin family protein
MEVLTEAEVLPSGSGTIAVETLVETSSMCAHTHEFVELAFVRSGRALQRSESGIVEIGPGDLLVVGPGSWHSYDPQASLEITNLYLSTALVGGDLSWLRRLPTVGPLFDVEQTTPQHVITFALGEPTARSALAILDRLQESEDGGVFARLARLFDLLAVLAPVFETVNPTEPSAMPAQHRHATSTSLLASRYRESVARAVSLLHDGIDRSWTVDALAREVSLSPSQLARVFNADAGIPPMAYLQRVRAERLAFLLRTTSVTVAAAARSVGWDDPSYASRRFRAYWHMTPAAYRTRLRESS